MIFINGCKSAPEIIQKDYVYEKMVFENLRFTFEIHLENFKDSEKVSQLIKKLIYQDKSFDEYMLFIEKEFIGDIKKEYYPTEINDDGIEYIYHSDLEESYTIEYYNDLFIIIKYFTWEYTGGAHGNYWFKYFIIDLTDEKILDIDELIYPIPDELLKEIIEEKYEIYYNLLDINRRKIWPPDTISFQKDDVILLWNVYSITPYSIGFIEININNNIIESYLTEKGTKLKKSFSPR
jgi:hypothetical protein